MNPTHPVEFLKQEHRIIEKVLDALDGRVAALGVEPFPREFFEQALDFFRNFADGCHHFKEEDTLFPALKESGVPDEGGPIGCMLKEHRYGRECMAGVRANLDGAARGDGDALAAVREHAGNYIAMLRQHIQKEDRVLFLIAHSVLSQEKVAELERRFYDPFNPKTNEEVWNRYAQLADRLAQESLAQPVAN